MHSTHHVQETVFQDFQDHFNASDTGIALVGGSIFGCLLLMGPAVALVVTKIGLVTNSFLFCWHSTIRHRHEKVFVYIETHNPGLRQLSVLGSVLGLLCLKHHS